VELTLPAKIGRLQATQEMNLAFEVPGRLEILVPEGSSVSSGQLVARLDSNLESLALQVQLQAALSLLLIGSVARVASRREDRADVLVERHALRQVGGLLGGGLGDERAKGKAGEAGGPSDSNRVHGEGDHTE
jgi:multidrug efflux pump subunit AcrA (membrane-fusion protein)